jgi:3,4-dihydroxy 2-butanone 4-phosphate synthase/GTP cyclohydrolase II
VKGARLDELELPPMVINNQDPKQTAFTVSVDVKVCSRRSAKPNRAARIRAKIRRRLLASARARAEYGVSRASPVILRAQEGTTTGISAFDRAATFRALASPTTVPGDFNRPGHVFPLRPREGGVLERDGHTEASVDFCKLAGLHECGVLSEICNEDGSMSRVPEVRAAPAQPNTPSHPLHPSTAPPQPTLAPAPGLSRRRLLSCAAAHVL